MYWNRDEVEKGKKIAICIFIIEMVFMMSIKMIKISKVGFGYKDLIYIISMMIVFWTFYRGNKISKFVIEIWMFFISVFICVRAFVKINGFVNFNTYICWGSLIFVIAFLFAGRKAIVSEELDIYYDKFMIYQHNKKSEKIKSTENIVIIISLLFIKFL